MFKLTHFILQEPEETGLTELNFVVRNEKGEYFYCIESKINPRPCELEAILKNTRNIHAIEKPIVVYGNETLVIDSTWTLYLEEKSKPNILPREIGTYIEAIEKFCQEEITNLR